MALSDRGARGHLFPGIVTVCLHPPHTKYSQLFGNQTINIKTVVMVLTVVRQTPAVMRAV